jgi:hypothetical protein
VSQIAEFFLVGRQHLPTLVQAAATARGQVGGYQDEFPRALETYSRGLGPFGSWSGYYFVVLLCYLDDLGIPLMNSAYDQEARLLNEGRATTFLLTPAHRGYLDRLDPAVHSDDELRRYFEAFNECEQPDAGAAMRDALRMLHGHLSALGEESALLLRVG